MTAHESRLPARRSRLAAVVAVALVVGACGDDGGEDPPQGQTFTTDGEMETGGIEVDTPEDWQALTMPALGFGLAVPPDWEAVVLSEEGLDLLSRAAPEVPGFAASAVSAAQTGAVFYAAGQDTDVPEHVNDLKVFADTSADVDGVDGLEDYARRAMSAANLEDVDLTVVGDAAEPTVDTRFAGEGTVPHGRDETAEELRVEGMERFVLAPNGAVYSFVVTGESADSLERLAPELLDTIAF